MNHSRAFVRCLALVAFAACVPRYSFDGASDASPAPIEAGPLSDASFDADTEASPPPDGGADAAVEAGSLGILGESLVSPGGVYPTLTFCSIRDGIVSCQGDNGSDELGRGLDAGAPSDLEPVDDPDGGEGFGGVTRVQVAFGFACAQRADQVFCWGDDSADQLGQGTMTPTTGIPERVFGLSGVQYFAANGGAACAVLADGGTSCWGDNYLGQTCLLNVGEYVDVPMPVVGLGQARDLAMGWGHTCAAIEPDGHVVCCGLNDQRQAGQATSSACISGPCVAGPAVVSGIVDVRQLALGQSHTCALLGDGSITCWGEGDLGELGATLTDAGACATGAADAAVACTETPQPAVKPPSGEFTEVAVTSVSTCGLADDGTVWCWGANDHGELGNVTVPNGTTAPVQVLTANGSPLSGITGIAGGNFVMCAVDTSRSVSCWGLGVGAWLDGGNAGSTYPVPTGL